MATTDGIELDPALIVEDDTATQRRLARLLGGLAGGGVQAIDTAASIAGARARIALQVPRLALVDIGLPDGNGIELIGWLHAHHPQVTTVVISAWGDEEVVLAALQAGAIGYLLKEREDVELELALQNIRRGGAPIDPFVARRILTLLPAAQPAATANGDEHALSDRETEILNLVARGHSNREIAELTELSRFTIEDYTKKIYRKLAVGSRTAAVFAAKSRGLLR
ncbi:response regulator transcription factor [Rhodanobacter sp. DHB23]|uniref:response regulator n=1 Tax=Rhodanobacter sp. DHB23 TaxID=2775923 RepID=UPI00177CDE8B|nr:response regulator transcription factor [Rhodanobacter sp. DHB23]MBD8872776.1 response regulator transcription factor [Rhodanobacter sp. DHB23]